MKSKIQANCYLGLIRAIFLSLILLLLGCQATVPPAGLIVRVMQVQDGATIEVSLGETASTITEQVRLEGLAAPGLAQAPWGIEAQQALQQMIGDRPVLLEMDQEVRDRNGRRRAYLWQGDTLLNEALIAEGYALFSPQPPNSKYDQRLAYAQNRSRTLGLGIWNPQNPLRDIKATDSTANSR
jgi:micrococcal nuclease